VRGQGENLLMIWGLQVGAVEERRMCLGEHLGMSSSRGIPRKSVNLLEKREENSPTRRTYIYVQVKVFRNHAKEGEVLGGRGETKGLAMRHY